MHALVVARHDRFAGLECSEVPDPRPEPGEISIDVQVAGVGLIDALWTTGAMPSLPSFIPGLEVSGVVRELGEDVTGFTLGQRVVAILPAAGGFAEIVCAPAALVAAIPDGVDTDVAAVVPINTVTAHLALTTVARFTPGESLLVHAGVGGLGSQFAPGGQSAWSRPHRRCRRHRCQAGDSCRPRLRPRLSAQRPDCGAGGHLRHRGGPGRW